MPIYEYQCNTCQKVFERLELHVMDIPTSQCPVCGGIGTRLMSIPSIVYEVFDPTAVHKLPDWNQKMAQAERKDKRLLSHMKEPLARDMGRDIKVYQTDFGKTERRKLESKAQLDNM